MHGKVASGEVFGEWNGKQPRDQSRCGPSGRRVPRHGLYVASDQVAYLDLGLRNIEEWGFPIGPDYVYTKAPEWEIRTVPEAHTKIALPQGLCVELKWLDGDEFAHWTNPESFATSTRNRRKRREWQVWNALQSGEVLENVVEITAPDGVHVIDHVTHTWLPQAPRPFPVDDPGVVRYPRAVVTGG